MKNCIYRQLGMSRIRKFEEFDFFEFFEILNFIFYCLAVMLVPELFKKLRETSGNNFHKVSSKSDPGCPSYLMLSHVNMGTLRRLIIVGGLITSRGVVLVVLVVVFAGPEGGFNASRSSGKPLLLLR